MGFHNDQWRVNGVLTSTDLTGLFCYIPAHRDRKKARRKLLSSVPVELKGELATHLDCSCAAIGAADNAEVRVMEGRVWLTPDRQVQRIERVKGKLGGVAVLEPYLLEDRHIGALEVLGPQVVASGCAVGVWRRIGESTCVEPVGYSLVGGCGGSCDVRPDLWFP